MGNEPDNYEWLFLAGNILFPAGFNSCVMWLKEGFSLFFQRTFYIAPAIIK